MAEPVKKACGSESEDWNWDWGITSEAHSVLLWAFKSYLMGQDVDVVANIFRSDLIWCLLINLIIFSLNISFLDHVNL